MWPTANIIITHQAPECVARMLEWWRKVAPDESLWIAYGGTRAAFEALPEGRKFFLESDRIRTSDPQRDRQSYQEVFSGALAAGALEGRSFVHVAEYDQLPVQPRVNELQKDALQAQRADVLGYRLRRVDRTCSAHYLSHWRDAPFREFLGQISVRPDKEVVLSFLGFGSFWTVAAFRAVAAVTEPLPIYLEFFMPTVAHHLGYRVKGIAEPEEYNAVEGDSSRLIEEATAAGIWNVHPVKTKWNGTTI